MYIPHQQGVSIVALTLENFDKYAHPILLCVWEEGNIHSRYFRQQLQALLCSWTTEKTPYETTFHFTTLTAKHWTVWGEWKFYLLAIRAAKSRIFRTFESILTSMIALFVARQCFATVLTHLFSLYFWEVAIVSSGGIYIVVTGVFGKSHGFKMPGMIPKSTISTGIPWTTFFSVSCDFCFCFIVSVIQKEKAVISSVCCFIWLPF